VKSFRRDGVFLSTVIVHAVFGAMAAPVVIVKTAWAKCVVLRVPASAPPVSCAMYGAVREIVTTPAAAVAALPPPASVQDWIARIESAKGALAKRNTLSRALDALHDKQERQKVIDTAARFELQPILEEVEGLAPHAAVGRLQRAIDGFRADNIPEELQAAVLRDLDTRWRKLS
jgi:hypothetical protein